MNGLIAAIVKDLVDFPEEVSIKETTKGNEIVYTLSVHPTDVGKVIGKQGRVAKAIRTVVNAVAHQQKQRVRVEIK
ncbi:MAG: KH domain-containing protein [Bacillaceae bacterium]